MRLFRERPGVVLAVYAHPDDADVAAGGAMARWASEGAAVHLVVTCVGDKGTSQDWSASDDLVARRADELESAARMLGLTSVTCLGYLDGGVVNDEGLRGQLVEIIRRVQPSVVVGPDPTATFFGGVYVNHRDHRETGWALLDAVAPAAAMPRYFPEFGAPHQVLTMLLSGTHEPDVAVVIDQALDAKVAAVLAHRSQLADDDDTIAEIVRARAMQAGRTVGVVSAEVFRSVEFGG